MNIINLTPHRIVLQGANGTRHVYESAGVARISATPGTLATVDGLPCPVAAPTTYGNIEGLPTPSPNTIYICSAMVAERAKRPDVLSPGTGPNDGAIREGGQVVAVTRLVAWAATMPQVAAPAPRAPLIYSDEPGSGGRRPPRLFFCHLDGSDAVEFKGQSIPGVAVVTAQKYNKNGKWSHTRYEIRAASDRCAVELQTPLHQSGVFAQSPDLANCGEVIRRNARLECEGRSYIPYEQRPIGALTPEAVRAFLAAHYPKTLERLDAASAEIAALP